MLVLNESILSS